MSTPVKLGLALGSGGARGLAHVGVLQVLEEVGLRPDVITGTSMGAIVGGLYAEKPDAHLTWQRILSYVNDEDFNHSWSAFVSRESGADTEPARRWHDLWDFLQRQMYALRTVTRPFVQDQNRLRKPLENLFEADNFTDLEITFAAVALDLVTGKRVMFRTGPLVDGIYASSAIPAIFPPLEQDDMMIIDGGGPFRVPVEACRELGADLVVAVDIPAFVESRYRTGLDIILRSNTIARQRLNNFVLTTADLVIRPGVEDFHWADFRAGEKCRLKGVEATRQVLPQLERMVKERGSWRHRWRMGLRSTAERLGLVVETPLHEVD